MSEEKESAIRLKILDEAVCIHLCANAFGKGRNRSPFHSPAISKLKNRLSSLVLGKEKLTKAKKCSLPDYLPTDEGRQHWFIGFSMSPTQSITLTSLVKIWTRVIDSTSYDNKHYSKQGSEDP